QFGRVRHGEAGAVQEVDVVAVPALLGAQRLGGEAVAGDLVLQGVAESEGQAATGLAVGGLGEVEVADADQVGAGGVALQDLLEEEDGGDDGGQGAAALTEVE